jgi:hypothetical protein
MAKEEVNYELGIILFTPLLFVRVMKNTKSKGVKGAYYCTFWFRLRQIPDCTMRRAAMH